MHPSIHEKTTTRRLLALVGVLFALPSWGFSANYQSVAPGWTARKLVGGDCSEVFTAANLTADHGAAVNTRLRQILDRNTSDILAVEGYVVAKRAYGNKFCFLDMITSLDASDGDSTDRQMVQCMIKAQDYLKDNQQLEHPKKIPTIPFPGLIPCLFPGSKVGFRGTASTVRNPGEVVLSVQQAYMLGLPRNPQQVATVIRAILQKKIIPADVVAPSLSMTTADLAEALAEEEKATTALETSKHQFQELAKKLVSAMPNDPNYPKHLDSSAFSPLQRAPKNLENVPHEILSIIKLHKPDTGMFPVTKLGLTGKVAARKRFQSEITTLEVVSDDQQSTSSNRVQCVLHPCTLANTSHVTTDKPSSAMVMGNLAALSSEVAVVGYKLSNDPDSLVWVTELTLKTSSWRPASVEYLVESAKRRQIGLEEAANALRISVDKLISVLNQDATARVWEAAERSRELQTSESRIGSVDAKHLDILASFEGTMCKYPIVQQDSLDLNSTRAISTTSKSTVSRRQRKKEPQLEWMRREFESLVQEHPEFGQRKLRVLDVGGGQGLLANHLASALGKSLAIEVVDIDSKASRNGSMRSQRLKLPVQYTVGDASVVQLSGSYDYVVALHACGVLTDVALGLAVRHQCGCLVCPCCFQSNPHLRVPSSDGLPLSAPDWLQTNAESHFALTKLAELQGDGSLASRATHAVCALRSQAVEHHSDGFIKMSIKTFPIAFSTRNFCLVGNTLRS